MEATPESTIRRNSGILNIDSFGRRIRFAAYQGSEREHWRDEMRTYEHPLDALDEWDLKSDSEIEKIISKDTIAILREAMELLAESDDEPDRNVGLNNFVAIVREMRRRKKRGSQALGRAILDASDWLDQGRNDKAREVYEAFLATCNIRFFRKIAESELERL